MSKFKMRDLKTGDIYKMSRILKKMDLKFEVGKDVTQIEMGVKCVQKILENLHMAETEVNEFLAELIGMTREELDDLPVGEVVEVFNQCNNQKEIRSCF